jgi:soluble lytic murein transglycosylase
MTLRLSPRLALAAALALTLAAPPARADQAGALRAALNEAGRQNWDAAMSHALGAGTVGRDVVEWQRLRAGEGDLGEYEDFLARRSDWPGLPLLKEKGEIAVARSTTPDRVLAYFGSGLPESGAGCVAVVRAFQAKGRSAEAEAEARRCWIALGFTPEEETALLALAPQVLAAAHEARLKRLLWDGKDAEARRMLDRVAPDLAALARARLALSDRADGVDTMVAAVPGALKDDPLLAQARFDWRLSKGLTDEAAALVLAHSVTAEGLGTPAAWAADRAVVARALLRDGKAETAYKVAASHHLTEGSDFADLEFLSGFIALRSLGDAETALHHFSRLKAAVATPISLSRADYWAGRAHQAKGDTAAATAAFQSAAQYQTAYYGLLAAETLGLPLDTSLLSTSSPGDWRRASFVRSSVLEAGLLLLKAGDRALGKRFILHLAETLSPAELAQLADLALTINEPHIAVLIAKQGAERGTILPEAYFPTPDMVPEGLAVSRAFALAISRRESEFDPAAQSPAGARGLMQLMPETAKIVAGKLGLTHETGMLTEDPAHNVRLGSAYLAQLVDEFGPSVALVASGYNAGPGRPRRWIEELGDPRKPEVDVVDWVEMIPFAETRTYVMRVSESLVIYRAKLKGEAGPVRLTAELKG